MRLSKIKTKEIRYVVWKSRLKRFLPHILTLCLAVIVAGGAFSAYSVYHKKHQKQLAKQSEDLSVISVILEYMEKSTFSSL